MKLRLLNTTTGKWVRDADSDDYRIYESNSLAKATQTLAVVNDLKRLNPQHRDDQIVLSELRGGYWQPLYP